MSVQPTACFQQPSTSSKSTEGTNGETRSLPERPMGAVHRPLALPLAEVGQNAIDFTTKNISKNDRAIKTLSSQNVETMSPNSSMERRCQQQQQQRWWRRRSAESNGKFKINSNIAVPSPAVTPVSNRSSELTNSVITSHNTGVRSKSSLHSGSGRSAFRIFKNAGSRSSQSSLTKAQIISPATSSLATSLSNGQREKARKNNNNYKLVHVHTLTKENIVVAVEPKCQVWDVFHCCCVYLGIDDDRLFGLAIRRPSEGFGGAEDRPRHEYFFLDPDQKISKYVPKQAKESSSTGSVSLPVLKLKTRIGNNMPSLLSAQLKPVIVVYMRVRVYVRRIDMISCDMALRHYYLQLRENLIDQWSAGPNSGASEEACWELAALAILTDRGREWRSLASSTTNEPNPQHNFNFRAEQYFPLWVINARGLDYIQENMPKVLRGYGVSSRITGSTSLSSTAASSSSASSPLTAASSALAAALNETEAMFQFCQEASRGPFALNCHLYGLRRHKTDILNNALLGITDRGIDMWDVFEHGERVLLRSVSWSKMARLSFDNKRITIAGVDGSKLTLYTEAEYKARYLLAFCREVHQQLIQINTNFVLNRPPNSPLLPPGWGLERLIDSSPISTSAMRHFNNGEYAVNGATGQNISHPIYNPKIMDNNNVTENLLQSAAGTTVSNDAKKTEASLPSSPQQKADTKKMVNRRSRVGLSATPPPFLQLKKENTKKYSSDEEESESEVENNADPEILYESDKKDADYYAPELDLSLAANEIVSAMNNAPSPPKYILASTETSTIVSEPSPSIKSKRPMPPPCLKQSKSNANPVTQSAVSITLDLSSTKETNSNYFEFKQQHLQQDNQEPVIVSNASSHEQYSSSQSSHIRPPPHYSEAIEQLRRTSNIVSASHLPAITKSIDNVGRQPSGLCSTPLKSGLSHLRDAPILAIQQKQLETQQQTLLPNQTARSTPKDQQIPAAYLHQQQQQSIPSFSSYLIRSNPPIGRPLNFPMQQKQWQSLTAQQEYFPSFSQQNQYHQQQQQQNYQMKYGSVVEGNSMDCDKIFYSFQQTKSEPELNFGEFAFENGSFIQQQPQQMVLSVSNVSPDKHQKGRKFASRSPMLNRGINRVKSMPTASTFSINRSNPNLLNNEQFLNQQQNEEQLLSNVSEISTTRQQQQQQFLHKPHIPPPDYAKTIETIQVRTPAASTSNGVELTEKPIFNSDYSITVNSTKSQKLIPHNSVANVDNVKISSNYYLKDTSVPLLTAIMAPPKYCEIVNSKENQLISNNTNNRHDFHSHQQQQQPPLQQQHQHGAESFQFIEPNVSNTEKFKNYPMMKALWEARHDLAPAAHDAEAVAGEVGENEIKIISNGAPLEEIQNDKCGLDDNLQQMVISNDLSVPAIIPLPDSVKKAPPSYNQYQQSQQSLQQQQQQQQQQQHKLKSTEHIASIAPTAVGNSFKVLDLPPPPPYPQTIQLVASQQSSARNTASFVT